MREKRRGIGFETVPGMLVFCGSGSSIIEESKAIVGYTILYRGEIHLLYIMNLDYLSPCGYTKSREQNNES